MQLGGLKVSLAFDMTVAITGFMVFGNLAGIFLIERIGRRGTMLWGTAILCVCLLAIGIVAVIKTNSAIWVQVGFMALWAFGKLPIHDPSSETIH